MSMARFSIIPGWIVTDPRLKGRDLQVLCLLGRYTNRAGWCVRSQVKMAGQLNCARSTVQLSLDRLVDIGAVEKRAGVSKDGRDTSYWYRVIYDREAAADDVADLEAEDTAFVENHSSEGDSEGPTPADISAPPADPRSAPPADPASAPYKNDPTRTTQAKREEREAREREPDGHGEDGPAGEDRPGTADFEKRVMYFCNGRGFKTGSWPNWDTSSPGHVARQFAKLSPEERAEAERWRDPYLADMTRRKKRPIPVANFFRDKLWTGLDPIVLERAEKASQQAAKPERPKDYAPPLGPVWSAFVHKLLLDGPQHPEHAPPSGAVWLRLHMQRAWPIIGQLWTEVSLRRGARLPEQWHGLKGAMEFVPVGTDTFEAWRQAYADRGWPSLPDPGDMGGIFFPKGGPAGLDQFQTTVNARKAHHDDHED